MEKQEEGERRSKDERRGKKGREEKGKRGRVFFFATLSKGQLLEKSSGRSESSLPCFGQGLVILSKQYCGLFVGCGSGKAAAVFGDEKVCESRSKEKKEKKLSSHFHFFFFPSTFPPRRSAAAAAAATRCSAPPLSFRTPPAWRTSAATAVSVKRTGRS